MNKQQIEQAAEQIARETHCRYCDRYITEDYKCRDDVEDSKQAIVALVQQAEAAKDERIRELLDNYALVCKALEDMRENKEEKCRE